MSLRFRSLLVSCLPLALVGPTSVESAQILRETYLTLVVEQTNVIGQWDVAVRDLQHGLAPDPPLQSLSGLELAERQEALALDTVARLGLTADGVPLALQATDYLPVMLNGVEYLRVRFQASGLRAPPVSLAFDGRAFFSIHPGMYGSFSLEYKGRLERVAFDRARAQHAFDLTALPGRWYQAAIFISDGIWHVWAEFHHVVFLIALILPSVLQRDGRHGIMRFRSGFIHLFKIVTALTVANSLSLSLATFEVLRLPAGWVEALLAASLLVAAGNNLGRWFEERIWWLAFAFGLVHGFGFASVLLELGLHRSAWGWALAAFNVGIELGQLALVAAFFPLAFALRHAGCYRGVVVRSGSVAIGLLALAWLLERAFA